MGVRKRGNSYFVDLRDAKGRRIRKSVGRIKSVAELFDKELELKIAREEHLGIIDLDRTPFDEYAAGWLERKRKTTALSTWRDYRSSFQKYVLPHFGKIPLCRIDAKDAELFLEKLDGLSGKRKNNVLVPLKCLFNEAKRKKGIRVNPFDNIPRFSSGRPSIDPFSFEEVRCFLESVDPWYKAYFFTAFFTGMRPSEMIALKWGRVDFSMRLIMVSEGRVQGIEGPLKTESSYRDVDMLDPLCEVLKRHRDAMNLSPGGYVFTGKNGAPLEVNNLRKRVWNPALKKAGLRKRVMYQTRHTFASLMLSHGEDPLWVSRVMGHTSTEMLYRNYGKYIRNRMRKDGMKFLQGMAESSLPQSLALPTNSEG